MRLHCWAEALARHQVSKETHIIQKERAFGLVRIHLAAQGRKRWSVSTAGADFANDRFSVGSAAFRCPCRWATVAQ